MQFEKVWLSKRELTFLTIATEQYEEVFDLSLSNKEFRKKYAGLQKIDVIEFINKLNGKLNKALDYA